MNADEIEKQLKEEGSLKLKYYQIKANTTELHDFFIASGMEKTKLDKKYAIENLFIEKNEVCCKNEINSYVASVLAAFIRERLLMEGKSFAFETVFSHASKLEFIQRAKDNGYRVYLYFITTEDPLINVDRVDIRVKKGGHPVPKDKIVKRYDRTMGLLYKAIKLTSRAFLFDNSGKHYELVATVEYGTKGKIEDYDKKLPNWFINYVIEGK